MATLIKAMLEERLSVIVDHVRTTLGCRSDLRTHPIS